MTGPRARLWAPLLTLTACGAGRYAGDEPWKSPPQIRLAIVARGEELSVTALDEATPLTGEMDSGERAELWILSYKVETLKAAFPGLADATADEILAALAPQTGAMGEPPPVADEVLNAVFGDGSEAEIVYKSKTWEDWSARASAGLAVSFGLPKEKVCGRIEVTEIEGPENLALYGVGVAGPDQPRFTARSLAGSPAVHLLALEGQTFRPLVARTEPAASISAGSTVNRPAWDPMSETFWDVDGGRRIYRFDLDGARGRNGVDYAVPPAPEPNPGSPLVGHRISVGRDGTAMATFYRDVEETPGRFTYTPHLYRLSGGAWVDAFPDVPTPGGFDFIRVVRRTRALAYYRCWLYYYQDPESPGVWKQSLLEEKCAMARHEAMRDVDLDEDGGVAVGNERYVWLLDNDSLEWVSASETLPTASYVTATSLGERRYLITDDQGRIFVYRGRRWCEVPSPIDRGYRVGAAAPVGGVAYLLSEIKLDTRPSTVVRVELR